mgnify:CR=1 FL=1
MSPLSASHGQVNLHHTVSIRYPPASRVAPRPSLAFARLAHQINTLYAADLLGDRVDRGVGAELEIGPAKARRERAGVQEFLDGATKAVAVADPWEGFVCYLENLFAMQAGDRGFNDFLSRRFAGNAETERIHDDLCHQIGDVLSRAQDAGQVRPDITLADLVNLIWSSGRIMAATGTAAPQAWRRNLYLMLDAYRADRAHPLPEPPMTDQQLYDAMVGLSKAD